MRSLFHKFNGFFVEGKGTKPKLIFLEKWKKKKAASLRNSKIRLEKGPTMNKKRRKEVWNLHIDSFFSQFLLNCMHQKMHVRLLRDINFILINRLYRERLPFLGQEVDSEISNQLIGLMVYLSIENDNKDLYLYINSPGGWVIPRVAIYDTMQFVQPDVHTICMGLAASMGSFILVGGEITKRLAFPHAWR
ncbi:hypothetical protein EUGRSUZ_G01320 [Eucalyptus grandis]|uniref:Uncharacterized protein n=2 Tax=Eucalyptus grandis TaxID=71139 RepID=A0ACC3K1Z6_EUCGR|nr:hypothetical protein EUGRSUZ_G01320 [Eucalyptus grandis]